MVIEANFDGLVGPTHNYAGLAYGNVASEKNAALASNPRAALLQGLEKIRLLNSLGVSQGVFLPQPRPPLRWLHTLGFKGDVRAVMGQVATQAPELLSYCYSSSGMWAANAATVTLNAEGATHITPANLLATAHRALEEPFTSKMLRKIFCTSHFVHHPALPAGALTTDEGAANHMWVSTHQKQPLHIFVHGRDMAAPAVAHKFPARQTKQAFQAIARQHGLAESDVLHLKQRKEAIDAGVFHNDVIATAHDNVLLYHAEAYEDEAALLRAVEGKGLAVIRVDSKRLSIEEAVSSYLFNSQIVSLPNGGMVYIAPQECAESNAARTVLQEIEQDGANPIQRVEYVDIKQSMRNGGGPACLRLRVPMTQAAWESLPAGIKFTEALYVQLKEWAEKFYPEQLLPADLKDPQLAVQALDALDALEGIVNMKGLYHD